MKGIKKTISIQKHTSICFQGCYQYLEACKYLGLGLLPIFRSTPILRFRVASSIQKHTSVQVQGCYHNLGYKKAIPIQKHRSGQVQGCYQYSEAYLYLGLGLLPVFRSTPVFRFRVATNISGIKEAIMIQKHTSIQVQGCYHVFFLVPRMLAEVHKKDMDF